jgi:hypothetical protein
MKSIVAVIVFCFAITASANSEFRLKFKDEVTVDFNASDWEFAAAEGTYRLFIEKTSKNAGKKHVNLHTMIEFDDPEGFKFEALLAPVKRIFTFGVLDCENGTFYLFNDFFVNKDHQVIHIQKHAPEEYMVNMIAPDTARNKVYLMVCKAK